MTITAARKNARVVTVARCRASVITVGRPARVSGVIPDDAWIDKETGLPIVDAETGNFITLNP